MAVPENIGSIHRMNAILIILLVPHTSGFLFVAAIMNLDAKTAPRIIARDPILACKTAKMSPPAIAINKRGAITNIVVIAVMKSTRTMR